LLAGKGKGRKITLWRLIKCNANGAYTGQGNRFGRGRVLRNSRTKLMGVVLSHPYKFNKLFKVCYENNLCYCKYNSK